MNFWRLIMSSNNLKKIRQLRKFTQKQLADGLGVSKQMISMWENNPNEKIPIERKFDLAELLNVHVDDFYVDVLDEKKIEFSNLRNEFLSLEVKLELTEDEELQEILTEKSLRLADRLVDFISYDVIINGVNKIFKDEKSEKLGKLGTISTYLHYLIEDEAGVNQQRLDWLLILLDEKNERKIKFLDFVVEYLIGIKSEEDYELDYISKLMLLDKVTDNVLNDIKSLFSKIGDSK